MAKRSRLAGRPGQRRPLQRTAGRPAATTAPATVTRPASSVTPEEEARAAELEAQILAEEQVATEARTVRERGRRGTREASGTDATAGVAYTSVPLAARAADEYRYVQRDVRRIAIVGGLLLLILAILDVLVNGMHLFTL